MAKRTKEDSTPEQVTPEGEPITNPEAQFPDAQPSVNEGAQAPEGLDAQGRVNPPATASLPGSGLPPIGSPNREGELETIRASGRPDPTKPPGESPPVEEGRQDVNPVQPTGTDRHYAHPADAREADVAAARGPDQSEAPPPFRRRDGFPDITSESVQVRLVADYYPADTSRYGNQVRGRRGELVSFGSDEALALIDAGLAVRVDDESVGFQQDLPQPGEQPQARGFVPRVNQDTGVPEAPPPEEQGSVDPAQAQSATSPRVEAPPEPPPSLGTEPRPDVTKQDQPPAEPAPQVSDPGQVVPEPAAEPTKDPEPGQTAPVEEPKP
jgi:hypothetical protein